MSTEQWYYTDSTGSQTGPVSTKELQKLLTEQQIPSNSMAWKDGMADWLMISQIDGFKDIAVVKQNIPTPPVAQQNTEAENLYAAPESDHSELLSQQYGGIGRLAFFGLNILIGIVPYIIIIVMAQFMPSESFDTNSPGAPALGSSILILVVFLGSFIISLWIVASRLRNIGMNGWMSLLILIPFVNIYITYKCFACQTGYVETKKLDTPGKIIAGIYLFVIIFAIALSLISVLFIGATAYKEGVERAEQQLEAREQQN